ncbi:MAG TPA: tetratricopeptide repeat protein [Thermoanaerobaculia bacterium]|nr:tetratricopeptide repeat protein [Thermoanaerobaculia bacterium]
MKSGSTMWRGLLAVLLVVNIACLAFASPAGPLYLANLLAHLALGLAFAVSCALWWWRHRSSKSIGVLLLLLSAVAGMALVVVGNRRGLEALVWTHVELAVAGCIALLDVSRPGRLRRLSMAGLVAVLVVVGVVRLLAREDTASPAGFSNPPAPLSMAEQAMGGEDGPFYPSAVSTRSGGWLAEGDLSGSAGCGRAGCHPGVLAEWSSSAHRFSGLDNPWYRRTYEEMRKVSGPVAARWCAGCHTPALLVTGAADRPVDEMASAPTAAEGVSCTVCHTISKVKSSLGQADYELEIPAIHRLATSRSFFTRTLYDLLVRANPEPHRLAYDRPVLRSAELCATCHKGHMDVSVNRYKFLGIMNDYDPWQSTSASGQGMTQSVHFPEPKSCVDCHMPPVKTGDAAGAGGHLRSHRFAAANTAGPFLRGDVQQMQAVVESLKSGLSMEIFAMSKGQPPAEVGSESPEERAENLYAPLDRIPATLRRGESTRFDVVLRSRDIGHMFPGGKYVLKDIWVEFQAIDDRGRILFWSGKEDSSGNVDPGAHFVSNLWINSDGRKLERYDIWAARAAVFAQRIEANTAFVVRFRLEVPPDAGDRITLVSRLKHRAFRPAFTDWVFEGSGKAPPRLPVVTIAETSRTLPVVDAGAALPDMSRLAMKPASDAERWNDYAFGLANRGDFILSRKAFGVLRSLRPDDAEVWTTLGNLEWALGNMEQARGPLGKALSLDPRLPRAHYYLGLVEQADGRYDEALEHLRAALNGYPREASVWGEVGRTLFLKANYREAVSAFGKSLAINPENPPLHFLLALCHRALGNQDLSRRHQALFYRLQESPLSQEQVGPYLKANPDSNYERQPLHEHHSVPLENLSLNGG